MAPGLEDKACSEKKHVPCSSRAYFPYEIKNKTVTDIIKDFQVLCPESTMELFPPKSSAFPDGCEARVLITLGIGTKNSMDYEVCIKGDSRGTKLIFMKCRLGTPNLSYDWKEAIEEIAEFMSIRGYKAEPLFTEPVYEVEPINGNIWESISNEVVKELKNGKSPKAD